MTKTEYIQARRLIRDNGRSAYAWIAQMFGWEVAEALRDLADAQDWIAERAAAALAAEREALAAEGRKITVKMSSFQLARKGLEEAITSGFQVTSIGFHFAGTDFRLTSDFHMKGIAFTEHELPEEEESLWAADAAVQVKKVSSAINELSALLSYKEEAKEAA